MIGIIQYIREDLIVAGLEYNGVIKLLAGGLIKVAGGNYFFLCASILIGSALFSAIFDNIPFVIAMIPLIKNVIVMLGADTLGGLDMAEVAAAPLWWLLALGACLGGNGTLVGASANVIVSKISEKNRYPLTFMHFTRYGLPFMFQSVIISLLYIWLRYFVFTS